MGHESAPLEKSIQTGLTDAEYSELGILVRETGVQPAGKSSKEMDEELRHEFGALSVEEQSVKRNRLTELLSKMQKEAAVEHYKTRAEQLLKRVRINENAEH